MVYGYCRCSTNENKQDINRQKLELSKQGVSEDNIYWEYESGTKSDRIEFNRLLDVIQNGDTIVATEVSRITRSTKDLCQIIEMAKDKHIKLILGSFIVDCSSELDPMTERDVKNDGSIRRVRKKYYCRKNKIRTC